MADIAADEPPSAVALERYRAAGWVWVITAGDGDGDADGDSDAGGVPIAGYVIVDLVDDPGPVAAGPDPRRPHERAAHIEQISVDPAYARRGLGRRLLDHVGEEARRRGLDALTLTTFRDVPWNAPYYERCGFRVLRDGEIGLGLRRVRDAEAAHGLDPTLRVCMRRELDRS
jgi:ribosomal protein S18 acetylase RimI-like enzyme